MRNTYCLSTVKSQSRFIISAGGCCRGGEKLVDAGPEGPSMPPRPIGFRGPVLLSLAPSARIMDLCLASVLGKPHVLCNVDVGFAIVMLYCVLCCIS